MRAEKYNRNDGSMLLYLALFLLLVVAGSLYYLGVLETPVEPSAVAPGPLATLRVVEIEAGAAPPPAPRPAPAKDAPLAPLPPDQLRLIRDAFAPEPD